MTKDYLPVLRALLPSGIAWNRDPASNLTNLLDALAVEFGRLDDAALDIIEESDPRLATDMIDEWEEALDLPDSWYTPTTLADRRVAAATKYANLGGQDLDTYQAIAANMDYVIEAEHGPYSKFDCTSLCSDPLTLRGWANIFRVYVMTGDYDALLMAVFRNRQRAHAFTEFRFSDITSWTRQASDGAFALGFRAATIGGGKYLIAGESGEIQYSLDGVTWYAQTASASYSDTFNDACYGNGTYLLVGNSGELQVSTNCVLWSSRVPDAFYIWDFYGCNYFNGYFWAVGAQGEVQKSADGNTWTHVDVASGYTGTFYSIAYDPTNGVIVLCGSGGEVQYSLNGNVWNRVTLANTLVSVIFSLDKFAILSDTGSCYSSSDGITWTESVIPSGGQVFEDIVYGIGHYVAIGEDAYMRYSKDAITWTSQATAAGFTSEWNSCAYGKGEFLLVGASAEIQTIDITEDP